MLSYAGATSEKPGAILDRLLAAAPYPAPVAPGALVGGNYDRLEDGVAVWEFRGELLQDREIVLRAVSVLE